jgi:predicted PhzF superfamily epimerase YddE/YHI9
VCFPTPAASVQASWRKSQGELRQFESIFLNPTGPQHHWHAHIFDLFEELYFAGHSVIGAAAVLHHQHGGDKVRGR